ncbi:geobacillin-26 family protein [Streptococcus phocae subsp. phocae]
MKIRTCASILMASLMIGVSAAPVSVVKVFADEISIGAQNNVISEDSEHRTIRTFSPEFNEYVTYTYHKNTKTLDIDRGGEVSSYDIYAIGMKELNARMLRSANSSLFSPWSYYSSGNRYTLKIAHVSYGGNPVSKTVTKNGKNAGYIYNFMRDVDNIRNVEIDLIKTAGWEIGATVIGALISGGVGAIGAITSAASIANVANQLPPIYDRALYNYKRA